MPFYVSWHASEVKFTVVFSSICVIRWPSIRNLYSCESWTLYRRHIKLLDQFHQRCLRRIMNIKWFNKVTNVKVLQKAKMKSIDTLLTLSQLRWSGHLVRMSDDRLPKQLFYSELLEGHSLRGRPTLRFKDTLKK